MATLPTEKTAWDITVAAIQMPSPTNISFLTQPFEESHLSHYGWGN